MVSEVYHFQDNKAAHREDLDLGLLIREDTGEGPTLCRSLLVSALIFQLNYKKEHGNKTTYRMDSRRHMRRICL